MGSELPSFTGKLLNTIKGNLQNNQRDRDAYLRNSGLDWSIGRGGILTNEAGGGATSASPRPSIACRCSAASPGPTSPAR